MKVSELVAYLQTLPQDYEVLIADYYYDCLEGYDPASIEDAKQCFKLASDTSSYQFKGQSLLLNTHGVC
jgi:hypothetical protein